MNSLNLRNKHSIELSKSNFLKISKIFRTFLKYLEKIALNSVLRGHMERGVKIRGKSMRVLEPGSTLKNTLVSSSLKLQNPKGEDDIIMIKMASTKQYSIPQSKPQPLPQKPKQKGIIGREIKFSQSTPSNAKVMLK